MSDAVSGIRPEGLYLWLCCEGWVRFGPFEWLRFDDRTGTILDSRGAIVAKRTDDDWVVDDPRYANWQFRNPTMTTTPRHPHANSGAPEGVLSGD